MNGAEAAVRTLLAGGVKTCFANPGTSEIHIVSALDNTPEIRTVLCLYEGVVTGAADGYARIAERPASTLLHLGPGLGNGLANLHNARRAHTSMVNIVGQHATFHLAYDSPLTSDIETIARPFSHWVRTAGPNIATDMADAITASRSQQGQIATLIIPADMAWNEAGDSVSTPAPPCSPAASQEAIVRGAQMLTSGLSTAILLSGAALYGRGLALAGRLAAASGAKLLAPYPISRLERGAGRPPVERVHYVLEQAKEQLRDFRQFLLVGARPPVAYFAYPNKSSVLAAPESHIHIVAREDEDCVAALEGLVWELGGGEPTPPWAQGIVRPTIPDGEITPSGLAAVVGAVLPEGTVVVDESMTSGRGLMASTSAAPVHDWLTCTGGSIGIAMPLAVGAAVAAGQERPILCLTADGSGMYTVQALWTMAREGLNVTTVVFANRSYAVLKREFSYLGVGNPGRRALDMFEIGRPDLDWVSLAKGMGVPGVRVTSLEDFAASLKLALEQPGPSLIEVPL